MNQREILIVQKNKNSKEKALLVCILQKWLQEMALELSKKTHNSCILPRKVPVMSRFLTKQGSMEIYWRKGGGERIGTLFSALMDGAISNN